MTINAYDALFRRVLCACDPEKVHSAALGCMRLARRVPPTLRLLRRMYGVTDPRLQVERFGVRFPNPVGLAGGFDKDGIAVPGLSSLGFGFIEVGTITLAPQRGNPRPRLFRLVKDQAIINRLGFPGAGSARVRRNLEIARCTCGCVIAANVGKSRQTSLQDAWKDYKGCIEALHDVCDFLVLNVSSPNTPGLRTLQGSEYMAKILQEAVRETRRLAAERGTEPKPILVKVSPHMSHAQLAGVVETCLNGGAAGIVATNTTETRRGLRDFSSRETGGLSGLPLRDISTNAIRLIYAESGGHLPIVGVGGVFDAADALEKLAAGASLIAAYTGLVYRGPSFAKLVCGGILRFMEREGLSKIEDIIGNNEILHYIRRCEGASCIAN